MYKSVKSCGTVPETLHKYSVLLISIIISSFQLYSQAPFQHTTTRVSVPGSEPREHALDILHMRVRTSFEPENGLVKGAVTHVFKVLQQTVDSVVFDAIRISISKASLGDRALRYSRTDSTVTVYFSPALTWDAVDSISFEYTATPRKGLYFIGYGDKTNRMRKQIWTQGQATDNRHWIPMYDEMNDKLITETITTVDSSFKVLSNGKQISVVNNNNGTKTWHYRMSKPHASYLLTLAIGAYNISERKSASGVPLYLYWYPEYPERVIPTYLRSEQAMDFLESELGIPYPWGTYSQVPVADYIFGAMENTTATTFGDFFLTDAKGWNDRSYVNVNVHELTHQWFGDMITARSKKGLWLQESFATFYPHLFARVTGGIDSYHWSRRNLHRRALAVAEQNRLPIVHPEPGGERIYDKGAAVLDMMRYTFGEESVRRVIQHYLKHHAFGNVETNDLYLSFQDTLGITPDWFFEQWLYKGGEPNLKVTYAQTQESGLTGSSKELVVDIEQIQPVDNLTGYFTMPIVVEAHYTDRTKDSVRVWMNGARTTVRVPNPGSKTLQFVLVDPGSNILKYLTFNRTATELRAQAQFAPFMIDRYDALVALENSDISKDEHVRFLEYVCKTERWTSVRAEAIRQLGKHAGTNPKAMQALLLGATDYGTDVRSGFINACPPGTCEPQLRALLADTVYSIQQSAFTKLCQFFPDNVRSYASVLKNVKSPHERIRIVVLEQLAMLGEKSAMAELEDLASSGWEFITRQNAMQAIKRTGILSEKAAESIVDAAISVNNRLSGTAVSVLQYFAEQPRNKEQIRKALGKRAVQPWQNDIMQAIIR